MSTPCSLSICIPTLNRADFIAETLDSIVCQLSDAVEVVLVDGGSTDGTEAIVESYRARHPQIRYVKRGSGSTTPSNEGFDRDCNHAVELAIGDYCWLMTDDDLLAPGAVDAVLGHLGSGPDLIMVSTQVCNVDFSNVLVDRLPSLPADVRYDEHQWARFVTEMGSHLTFLGRIVIRRSVWLERERGPHFGSGFVHVGVLLSAPLRRVLVLAAPLVVIRYGNGLWRSRAFDIWMYQWPRLIWSSEHLPDAAKLAVTRQRPYRSLKQLFWFRALGAYSLAKYRERLSGESSRSYRLAAAAIAALPLRLANALSWLYLFRSDSHTIGMQLYDLLRCGHTAPLSRHLARRRNVY